MDAKDISVDITPLEVVIKAATGHKHTEDQGEVHRCEFTAGQVFRSLSFPKGVDVTKAKADYKNVVEHHGPDRSGAPGHASGYQGRVDGFPGKSGAGSKVARSPHARCVHVSVTASGLTQLFEECGALRSPHPNVLVVGSEAACVDLLDGVRSICRQPVETCEARSFPALPPPSRPGTLILRDVGSLTQEGQRRLSEWLDDITRNRIQVIATDSAALWPRVRDGSFTEALYYRLNVIYIDLTEGAAL